MKTFDKAIWGWAMYDWANSAFATTVMAGFFPIFFKTYWSSGADVNVSTARLGFGNALAGLVVACMAPVLGAIADKAGARKKFLIFFTYIGVIMTSALFVVHQGQWAWAIFIYAAGVIGFSGSMIFYDALLPSIAEKDTIDYVSGLGYAMGYLGGGILFLFNVWMTLNPHRFGFTDSGQAVQYAFLSVAAWWGVFSLFAFVWVPDEGDQTSSVGIGSAVKEGCLTLFNTIRRIRQLKTVFLFLAAYWCYIDGVDTVVRMSVDYGLSIGFASNDLIVALLMVQFIGFPSALGFGKLGQTWGARKAIFLAIGVYSLVTVYAMTMTHKHEFYVLAGVIGLVQGGIQALSRSYFSRLIPAGCQAEFYGFYNMLGKFAAIIGPALIGAVGLMIKRALMPAAPTADQMHHIGQLASRLSIGSILVLFVAGAVLLLRVDEEKGRHEAERFV